MSFRSTYNDHIFPVCLKPLLCKKSITLLVLLVTIIFSVTAQWVKGIGGAGPEYGQVIKVDAAGNVFITGNFAGTADFDPGPGVFNLKSSCPCDVSNPPKSDIFLAKYDRNGNFLWAAGIGGSGADLSEGLGLDAGGNVYITGLFWGTADFDPGPGTRNLVSAGSSDIFLAKFDTNGNLLWANNFGGTSNDTGDGLAVDASGNAFVTGSFFGIADLDPGPGTTDFNSNGSTDVFFAKFNAAGGLVWAKDIEGSGEQNGHSIDLGPGGDIYITGTFFGTSDLDPGPGVTPLTGAGSKDPFFAKYNAAGDLVWARSIGSAFDEQAVNIAVDAVGNLYAAGYFTGTTDFDPGAGTSFLTSSPGGLFDAFLLKLNADGNFQWAFKAGNTGDDNALSVSVDATGDPYICGSFQGTVDFDPGPGIHNLTGGGNELYFAKYSAGGNFLWAERDGSAADEVPYSISVDAGGNVYLTGYFTGSPAFQTGAGSALLTSAGNADVLLLKFQPAIVLPLEFISFTGKREGISVMLQWTITPQNNNYGFEIERSTSTSGQTDWEKIGSVPNGSGSRYQFTDPSPLAGKLFYRLRQVDMDGHFKYSSILSIATVTAREYVLDQNNPNPVTTGSTTIRYSLPERSFISLELYDPLGRQVMILANEEKAAGSYQLNVDCSHLQNGTYYYKLNAGKSVMVRKIMVVR